MLVQKWKNWDENQKSLFILVTLGIFGFLVQIPLFLLHDGNGFSYGAYPLGWLLGSFAEILAFLSMTYMVKTLSKGGEKSSVALLIMGSFFLRFLLYIGVLIVSAICTFKPDLFGGFSGFNFYTCFAALLPLPVVTWIFHFLENKKSPEPKKEETKTSEIHLEENNE